MGVVEAQVERMLGMVHVGTRRHVEPDAPETWRADENQESLVRQVPSDEVAKTDRDELSPREGLELFD